MNTHLLDLYSDYLISSFSQTTATGLSAAVDGVVSHDQVTRFLAAEDLTSKDLWKQVKPIVRSIESAEGVLIIDDTVEEKPYTDESELVTYHFDHTVGRSIKGLNVVSCLYHSKETSIAVGFEPVKKPLHYLDPKTGKERRKSLKTKNELMRDMLEVCTFHNHIQYRFVLADIWFACSETMTYIKNDLKKDFLFPIKSNRLVKRADARSSDSFVAVQSFPIQEDVPVQVRIEGVEFPLLLLKHVFKNEDGSEGTIYLVCSDLTVIEETILTIYQKRWHVEEYHKSLKSNLGLNKSPTHTIRTQVSHIFASIYAHAKLEILKTKTKLNHFALKAKLYLRALHTSMDELTKLKVQYQC